MKYLYAIIVLLLLVSCQKEDNGSFIEELPAPRVVIAYLCGDNNLSWEVDTKIDALYEGMKQMGKTENRLIVYADYCDAMPVISEITCDGVKVVEKLTERNSASPDNLKSVLQKIVTGFPAQTYGLICFSHASGWLPKGALNNPFGFTGTHTKTIFEDNSREMPVDDFAEAIDVLPQGKKYEFILFETCFMTGMEIIYPLREKTKYIVGSSAEMLSDGFVEIYPENLCLLFETQPRLKEFARNHFNHWNSKSGAWRSATVSVINTACVGELSGEIKKIFDAVTIPINIHALQYFNRNPYRLFFDLGELISHIGNKEQVKSFNAILEKVVEYQASTPVFMSGYANSFTITAHSGITVYIEQNDLETLNSFYRKTRWRKFIERSPR